MFYKKNKSLSFETLNLLRSHTACGVYTYEIYIIIYLFIY